MTSEQASFLLQTVLPALEKEHGLTLKMIQAVPVEQGGYRPAENSMSANDLAWHIASAENMFLAGVASGAFQFGGTRPESVKTTADVAKWYAETFAGNLAKIRVMTGEQLNQPVDFRGMFQWPAVTFLQFAMNHTIHHRGQLSVYLRPMGAKVPSVYGFSYDESPARKAAQQ
jgi:uncharacterized damage-inducible protein DinB